MHRLLVGWITKDLWCWMQVPCVSFSLIELLIRHSFVSLRDTCGKWVTRDWHTGCVMGTGASVADKYYELIVLVNFCPIQLFSNIHKNICRRDTNARENFLMTLSCLPYVWVVFRKNLAMMCCSSCSNILLYSSYFAFDFMSMSVQKCNIRFYKVILLAVTVTSCLKHNDIHY